MEFSHLEKMGRELKCPICLSLLKFASTLACNHVFCNSCIVESMKSATNCPVCKLPFRRREVRPALHMDNLVSIYKNMEAALGLTIFTSQVAPQKKHEEHQFVDEMIAPKCIKKSSKGKRKKMEKHDSRTDPCPTRPSFSSSKRIHVTPYPVCETPLQPKRVNKSVISTTEAMERCELESKEPALPPFFWLRETNEDDDLERITTQETAGLMTPKSIPCFSDIKDSDDDSSPNKATPNSKSLSQRVVDSEMFEWTQRDCSPELFSTPQKQTAGGKKYEGCSEDKCTDTTTTGSTKNGTSKKKRRKQTNDKKYIIEKSSISLIEGNPFGSSKVHDSSQTKVSLKKAGRLRSTTKVDQSCKNVHRVFSAKEIQNHDIKATSRIFTELCPNNSMEIAIVAQNTRKRTIDATTKLQQQRKRLPFNPAKLKTLDTMNVNKSCKNVHRVFSAKEIQNHDIKMTSRIFTELCPNNSTEIAIVAQNTRKRTNDATSKSHKQSKRLPLNPVELKTPDTNPIMDNYRKHELDKPNSRLQLVYCKQNQGEVSCTRTFSKAQEIKMDARKQDEQQRLIIENVDVTTKTKELLHLTTNTVLRKCEVVCSPVSCAFCHSTDSEVSGEIMHYCNGKSVSSDFNGGINVIHCHKGCAEWAPDTFFKDDLVINLSTELARSRRITCCCCGIKGAALGCFEKSCRRSFHYPCAKQTPECRWDHDNFVMLCPLHSSSKFPSETSELQKLKKRKHRSKREVSLPSQPIDGDEGNCKWAWPPGLPCKWVLCSSALSGTEKEVLSKFASLTGISVSKTWCSAVTHVIASTDANGACKRTLKFLMGIIEGKWILSIEWIKSCMMLMKPDDEEKYEISMDVHGIHNGPHLGRMRIVNKEPKLFTSFCFYFCGDFVASYKGYLHDLITAAGGKVLLRKPISTEHKEPLEGFYDKIFIVYSLELPEKRPNQDGRVIEIRKAESIALAEECGAKVVTNSWILDSIAASTLQTD